MNYPNSIFKKVHIDIQKNEYVLGKIVAFLSDLTNIPALPGFRSAMSSKQIASGIQAILALQGNVISIENIEQILDGKSIPQGRKFQEEEVRKIVSIRERIFREIVIENKPPFITPEYIKKLHLLATLGEENSNVKNNSEELDEWLNKFCEFLEKGTSENRPESKTTDLVKAILVQVYFDWMQPFGPDSIKTSHLLGLVFMLKAGIPYSATYILPVFYNETKTEHVNRMELVTKQEDMSTFLEYALLGFSDGLESTIRASLAQQFLITWHYFVNAELSNGENAGTKVTDRRAGLMKAIPLTIDNGLSFEQILVLNPGIARAYAKRTKTARRDLAALLELGLLVKRKRKYYPNVISLMGEMAGNTTLLKIEFSGKKEVQYSHTVMPVVSSLELKSELLKLLGKLEPEE